MDTIIKRLSEIEDATAKIMENVNLQKKEYAKQIETKTAQFDNELQEKTNIQLTELRDRLTTEMNQKLAAQKQEAQKALETMEDNYKKYHTLYVKQLMSSLIQV